MVFHHENLQSRVWHSPQFLLDRCVQEHQLRFRALVTAMHTRKDLDEALNIIEDTVVRAIGKRI